MNKQEIKEEAIKNSQQVEQKPLPKITLTEMELDEFAKSIATGKPFSRVFDNKKIPNFKLTIRDKTRKESEIITRCLDRETERKKILNWVEYNHTFNTLSLYYQVDAINGVEHVREYPKSVYDDFDALSAMEKSPVSSWNASQLYIAMGYMFQFNAALMEASQSAFDLENFI